MRNEVIITCAITGSGDSRGKNPNVPVTPEEIAAAAVEAAKAGAAAVHVHVRDPETTLFSRDIALYEEAASLIRASGVDMILNITAGMGADYVPDPENPNVGGPGTDMLSPADRAAHIVKIKPDIATLDCGSFNYISSAYVAPISDLRQQAKIMGDAGVRVEVEIFDAGHLWQAKELINEGYLDPDSIFQLCMGVPYGIEATPTNLLALIQGLPKDVEWTSFAVGKMQLPWVPLSVACGGHVRVGLEDNIWLEKGVPATNGQLVERAKTIIEAMNVKVLGPDEARKRWKLSPR